MATPFPCSPVIRECSWKETQIEKKSSNITGETEIQYLQQEIKKQAAKSAKLYDNIPWKIKSEIRSYALIHGTKEAIDWTTGKVEPYPKFLE